MCGGKFAFKIRLASLIVGRKLTVFLCFTLYLRAISKYKPSRGLIFGGASVIKSFADPELQKRGGGGGEGSVIQTLRKGGSVSEKTFSPLRASVWSKIKGGSMPAGPLP